MAEQEDDAKLSRHYRDLGREEPPRHLDDAILAAARRDVRRKPRWLYPVAAAAAVGVLAVAVSVHVEREQPEEIVAMKDSTPPEVKKQEEPPKPAPGAPPVPKSERRVQKAPAPVFVPDPKPPAEVAGPRSEDVGGLARSDAARDMSKPSGAGAAAEQAPPPAPAARARMAERPLAAMQLDEAPMPWLQRIARLREEGKHEEADRALAEFRKRYPDFRIPEDMLGKVVRP